MGIKELTNGNYVVPSQAWNGSRGAVTWASGTTGIIGVVSSTNSLVCSTSGDSVGIVVTLTNGNYSSSPRIGITELFWMSVL